MIDLIRCRGRASRFAVLTLAAFTLFALVLVATPASAAPPSSGENFNPDNNPSDATGSDEEMVLSDRPDGTNSTFHVVTVATAVDTTRVGWFKCPVTYSEGSDPTDPTEGCDFEGEDTSGEGLSGGLGEAYEMDYNVPDDNDYAWVSFWCSQQPYNTTNCADEVEQDVTFDDSSTGSAGQQSAAGEITSPANPSAVSSDGFVVTGTTSPDVTDVQFCLDDASATVEPFGSCDGGSGSVDGDDVTPSGVTAHKVWEGFVNPDDPGEYAVMMFESAGGAADDITGDDSCTGDGLDCQLDSHYVVASPPTPTSAALAFPDYDPLPDPPGPGCDDPAPHTTTVDDTVPAAITIEGCIFDQSGNNITDDQEWAFQLTPRDPDSSPADPLGFDDDDNGDENDTNTDDFFEQVDGAPGDAGTEAEQFSTEFDTAGTYTAVFCLDADNNADDGHPTQSATPCSGESLSASGTINLSAPADHVHVKRQGTEGPQCHTGGSSTTAPAGSTVNLVGCALAQVAAPGSPGAEQPAPNTEVLWIVNPAGNPADPGQIPTSEDKTDSAGKADAVVTSGAGAADKTTTVRFCRDEFPFATNGNGICDSAEPGGTAAMQADFQINWTAPAAAVGDCPPPYRLKRGNNRDNRLKGTATCDRIKGKGGDDRLRGKGEDDLLIGGRGFDRCYGGPGADRFRGCEFKKQ